MLAKHLIVTGHVQGVFFRDGAKRKAEELGVNGWVRNDGDGSVEIHAEGSDDALKELEGWCRRGPPRAMVECVRVEETTEEGFTDFEIRW